MIFLTTEREQVLQQSQKILKRFSMTCEADAVSYVSARRRAAQEINSWSESTCFQDTE